MEPRLSKGYAGNEETSMSKMEPSVELLKVLHSLDKSLPELRKAKGYQQQDVDFIEISPLNGALQRAGTTLTGGQLVSAAAMEDPGCDSAIGCLIGLALGDAVGAPLEFRHVDGSLPDVSRGGYGLFSRLDRPCLLPHCMNGELIYKGEFNKFELSRGQWTDDTSMALCLADSLLVHGRYCGGDARVRWHMWWTHGYCNAFRHDEERGWSYAGTSVGLGGNIGKSLDKIEELAINSSIVPGVRKSNSFQLDMVPAIYASKSSDAGNGSIMRLAPVPIAYHSQAQASLTAAVLQSCATHPGADAAGCCCFMTFFILQAIAAHQHSEQPQVSPRAFVERVVADFLMMIADDEELIALRSIAGAEDAIARIRSLLMCEPPSPCEQNWDWKKEKLRIEQAIQARGESYNGYPVDPCYFGSYCIDGLAMALWSLWHSTTFSSCILRAVNLLGDADTVGAIAGQLAGALFGYESICADEFAQVCLHNLKQWDPHDEICLRAALLYHQGSAIDTEEDLQADLNALITAERKKEKKEKKKDKKERKTPKKENAFSDQEGVTEDKDDLQLKRDEKGKTEKKPSKEESPCED